MCDPADLYFKRDHVYVVYRSKKRQIVSHRDGSKALRMNCVREAPSLAFIGLIIGALEHETHHFMLPR